MKIWEVEVYVDEDENGQPLVLTVPGIDEDDAEQNAYDMLRVGTYNAGNIDCVDEEE